ncbi:MAG: FMN-binding protein [Spirochaetales bacterium]|nr:FMN-binding protein [Spirochaetales bacterium]
MKKKSIVVLIILLTVLVIIGGSAGTGCVSLSREHDEARNLPITSINFSKLKDGTYTGEYEGGMYRWRANKVNVTVSSGKVTVIDLQDLSDSGDGFAERRELYNRIIEAQSLQVDVISGATLTSKAYLKGVEIALSPALAD